MFELEWDPRDVVGVEAVEGVEGVGEVDLELLTLLDGPIVPVAPMAKKARVETSPPEALDPDLLAALDGLLDGEDLASLVTLPPLSPIAPGPVACALPTLPSTAGLPPVVPASSMSTSTQHCWEWMRPRVSLCQVGPLSQWSEAEWLAHLTGVTLQLDLKKQRARISSVCGRLTIGYMNMRPCPPRKTKSGRVVPKGYFSTECEVRLDGVRSRVECGRWRSESDGWAVWFWYVVELGKRAGVWGVWGGSPQVPRQWQGSACRPHWIDVEERLATGLQRITGQLSKGKRKREMEAQV